MGDISETNKSSAAGDVLVFGGNGLMGSRCVEELLAAGYKVTVANRGTWYWDTEQTIKDMVTHIRYDRNDPAPPVELTDLISSTKLDAIIDFSAFEGRFVERIAELVKSNPPSIYIYISSDSVYEVVEKADPSALSREEDAVRPRDPVARESLAKRDDYGHGKLEVEEALIAAGIRHVALRLPDVLGERDNTMRWWVTFLWLGLPDGLYRACQMLDVGDTRLSFVYAGDVSAAILKITRSPQKFGNDLAINFAWADTISVAELYAAVAQNMGVKLKFEKTSEGVSIGYGGSSIPLLFPSVTRGPIDVTKAKELGLEAATDWRHVLSDCIQFYQNALTDARFQKERDAVISSLADVVGEKDPKRLLGILLK